MKTVRLKKAAVLPDEEADALAGKLLDTRHYDHLIQDRDTTVYKPDGSVLLILRAKVLPAAFCRAAYPALRGAARKSFNRGYAAGEIKDIQDVAANSWSGNALIKGSRFQPIKEDGTLSQTTYAKAVDSGIIGFFDRYPRIPYCRLTAFNLDHPKQFKAALPLIRSIDKVFAADMPERYTAQKAVVEKTSPDFVIHGTAFTTITVNRNWQTAVHKDAGDLKDGFGVMTALRAGRFKGCYLCFPKYRVAVDMQTRDVLLADVHEWHGNTPIVGIKGQYERISLVLYYREGMVHCGSAAEELKRAKKGLRTKK